MKRKSIDFRELLERLLPLDELPPASRMEAQRALKAGAGRELERAALLVLAQLEQQGAVRRLPAARNGSSPVLRYQARDSLDVITIELPEAKHGEGILAIPRATLPERANADLGPVRRLLALDDNLVADPGQARPWLIDQLSQVAEALAAPHSILYCPDTALAPSIEPGARRYGVRAMAVAGAIASDGTPLGHLEALSPEVDPFRPEDLALVVLLADTVAGLLERAARIQKLVFVDPLTSAFNRAYFDQEVHAEMARAQRDRTSMALLIADIDNFKSFNTAYGYEAGNQVLVEVAGALKQGVRPFDLVARWGGEEFVVVLTAPVEAVDAAAISERLRAAVERAAVRFEGLDRAAHSVGVTVSVGGALFPDHAATAQELWRAANQALLAAKHPPKNQVVFFRPAG